MTWLATAVKAFWQLLPVYDAVARRAPKAAPSAPKAPPPPAGNRQLHPDDPRARYRGWRH